MTAPSNSVVNQDLIMAARQGLLPTRERSLFGGFGNMLRKEIGQWWGTRTWWVQTLIWVLILNGITTVVMLTETLPPADLLQEAVQTFLPVSMGVVGIGTIVIVQGAVIGEKQLGTAAWVISKPVSRYSFILAKAIAYVIGIWITAIVIPSLIFVIETALIIPVPLNITGFMAGVALAALSQLFYLTLTLMLGTLFTSRGPVTGIGIAIILTGLLLKSMIPMPVMLVTPWPLPDIGSALTLGTSLPSVWPVPVAATVVWIVIMTIVACWRFGREEF
jgi:ABC-2 type transport system permease protein